MQESCLLIENQCEFHGLQAAAMYEVRAEHCPDEGSSDMCSVIAEREVWSLPKGNASSCLGIKLPMNSCITRLIFFSGASKPQWVFINETAIELRFNNDTPQHFTHEITVKSLEGNQRMHAVCQPSTHPCIINGLSSQQPFRISTRVCDPDRPTDDTCTDESDDYYDDALGGKINLALKFCCLNT